MESILQWDTAIMHWINDGWSNALFDFVFPLLRNKFFWLPLYVLCVSWIIYNHRVRHVFLILFFLGLSIFASDTISSKLIKYQVGRIRPCQELSMDPPVIIRVKCGSGLSFPSSHAANHFCVSAFFISIFGSLMGRWKYLWWLWAALISLAQVYVGLHYPLDILGGAVLGCIVGISMGRLCYYKLHPVDEFTHK
jgi:undecaprenyl-diphosphatase